MKENLELITLFISVFAFVTGGITWYTGAVKQRYAAQRDFEHLKRSYNQLADNMDKLLKEQDNRFDEQMLELKEVKGVLLSILVKVSPETSTSFYRRNDIEQPRG